MSATIRGPVVGDGATVKSTPPRFASRTRRAGSTGRTSKPSLEDELTKLLGPGRDALIVALYSGFTSYGRRTLASIAAEFGVSRERVRQIVAKRYSLSGTNRYSAPVLDRVIQFVRERMPAEPAHLEKELLSAGLTSASFRLEVLLKAAALFGRPLPFTISRVRGTRIAHSGIAAPDRVIQMARAEIDGWGASTIEKVALAARQLGPSLCEHDFVERSLTAQDGFRWIDRATGWFWFSDSYRNPLLNRVRKAVSVSNPIDVTTLRAGIARGYKAADRVPPAASLLSFCSQVNGLQIRYNKIYANPPVDPCEVLNPSENEILHILSRQGVMSRGELMSLWIEQHRRPPTLDQVLRFSPIIYKDSLGMYGLNRTSVS